MEEKIKRKYLSIFLAQKILNLDDKSANLPTGDCGGRPLHLCACMDRDECAKILVRMLKL